MNRSRWERRGEGGVGGGGGLLIERDKESVKRFKNCRGSDCGVIDVIIVID